MVSTADFMNYNTKISLPLNKSLAIALMALICFSCTPAAQPDDSDGLFYFDNKQEGALVDQPISEATSLFGHGLVRPEFDSESIFILTEQLRESIEMYDGTATSITWVARRTAAMWRYQDAVVVLTDGLEEFPETAELLRYRGHYLFVIREFAVAEQDLARARRLIQSTQDVIETDAPDGSIIEPSTTLHYSIWFYSGLIHYVKSDYIQAAKAFETALAKAQNADTRITATDWLVLSLFKSHQDDRAREILFSTDLNAAVTDAQPYLERLRLLYDFDYTPVNNTGDIFDEITITYGLAFRAKLIGNQTEYRAKLNQVIDTNIWAAISYIVAESDLKKLEDGSI